MSWNCYKWFSSFVDFLFSFDYSGNIKLWDPWEHKSVPQCAYACACGFRRFWGILGNSLHRQYRNYVISQDSFTGDVSQVYLRCNKALGEGGCQIHPNKKKNYIWKANWLHTLPYDDLVTCPGAIQTQHANLKDLGAPENEQETTTTTSMSTTSSNSKTTIAATCFDTKE